MVIKIGKIVDDGIEYLPDITETVLFPAWAGDGAGKYPDTIRKLAKLYFWLCQRENFYQIYSPTAFGNPEYTRLRGAVLGFLDACGWDEITMDGVIYIKKHSSGRTLLIVEKPNRPDSYKEDLKDIRKTLDGLGF